MRRERKVEERLACGRGGGFGPFAHVGSPGQLGHCMWVFTVSMGYIRTCSATPAIEPANMWVRKEPEPSHSSQSKSTSSSGGGEEVKGADMEIFKTYIVVILGIEEGYLLI